MKHDFRIVRPDGGIRHIRTMARYEGLFEGHTKLIGVNIDVTEDVQRAQELESIRKQLEHDSRHDALTGLVNRGELDEQIKQVFRKWEEEPTIPFSIVFLDIDHFKSFNDLYGHTVGDQVLRYVAEIIKKQMRLSDVLARYGGEEFSVILTNTDAALAKEVAERIRAAIANAILTVDSLTEDLNVTVSIGCTTMKQTNSQNTDALGNGLLASSDQALYIAKDSGRNCVKVAAFNEPVSEKAAL